MRFADLNAATQTALFASGEVTAKESRTPGKRKSQRSEAAERFAFQVRAYRLPECVQELAFAQEMGRKWRFDFAWPAYRVALEVEGLVVQRIGGRCIVTGAHATVTGMREDMEKYNAAAELGWYVLRVEQTMIQKGDAIAVAQRVLTARGWSGIV